MTMTILAMLFLLELQMDWKPKAPHLTIQDVREILKVILPKREITSDEILKITERKHKAIVNQKKNYAFPVREMTNSGYPCKYLYPSRMALDNSLGPSKRKLCETRLRNHFHIPS